MTETAKTLAAQSLEDSNVRDAAQFFAWLQVRTDDKALMNAAIVERRRLLNARHFKGGAA